MGFINEIIIDIYEIITIHIRYDKILNDNTGWGHGTIQAITDWLIFGRYTPDSEFHYESWMWDGTFYYDYTNTDDYWGRFYYPRTPPYPNIPNDEKIHNLHWIWYGVGTATLWALYNEIIIDNLDYN